MRPIWISSLPFSSNSDPEEITPTSGGMQVIVMKDRQQWDIEKQDLYLPSAKQIGVNLRKVERSQSKLLWKKHKYNLLKLFCEVMRALWLQSGLYVSACGLLGTVNRLNQLWSGTVGMRGRRDFSHISAQSLMRARLTPQLPRTWGGHLVPSNSEEGKHATGFSAFSP